MTAESGVFHLWRYLAIGAVVLFSAVVAFLSLEYFATDWVIVDLGYRHFASIFGLPAAAAAALLIVLVTRSIAGQMKVKILGFEFEGAAGETVMWVVCFLAIVLSIVQTWNLKYDPPPQTVKTMLTEPPR